MKKYRKLIKRISQKSWMCDWCKEQIVGKHNVELHKCPEIFIHEINQKDNRHTELIVRGNINFKWFGRRICIKEDLKDD